MKAKRFIAADMRRALDMVKDEYGEDAMIISTERTAKGVELVATAEASMEQLQSSYASASTSPLMSERHQKIAHAAAGFQSIPSNSMPQAEKFTHAMAQSTQYYSSAQQDDRGPVSGKTKQQLAEEMELANRKMQAARKAESMTLETWADKEYATQQKRKEMPINQRPQDNHSNDAEIRRLHEEISDMRTTLEVQLLHMADMQERQYNDFHHEQISYLNDEDDTLLPNKPSQPVVARMKKQLDFLSLPKAANDKVIESLQKNPVPQGSQSLLWTHILTKLSRHIPSDTSDPVAQGGIYAFLGTTGVGKTTTIAKLSARYVMEHGPEGVVLLTTDTQRIAAYNQLTSLAKVLNVRVEIVEDLQRLPDYLAQLTHCSLILIDTPGMSHSDPLLKPHLQVLQRCEAVQNVLVVPANNQYQMMKASLHSYSSVGLDYCVMTKLDECATLSDAMGVLIEHELPLAYITDGQSVPEDIDIVKSSQFVSRAVNLLKKQRKYEGLAHQHLSNQ